MKFGKGKTYTRKNNFLKIPIGMDGIGEESHPIIKNEDLIEEKVLNIVMGKTSDIIEETDVKQSKMKLYLNTIINLLSNNNKKTDITKPSSVQKTRSRLINWWRKETTNDLKDIVTFIAIHGVLGSAVVLSILSITNIDISIINIIKGSKWATILMYIIGSGSAYYLFLDLNTYLEETWRSKKK